MHESRRSHRSQWASWRYGAQGPAGADGVGDTYDGTPFALRNQTCNAGDVIAGIAADGAARCESDANDMYGAGWLDDDKRAPPLRPATGEPNPASAVLTEEAWPAPSPLENLQLLTQRCDLQQQVAPVGNCEPQRGPECEQIREHFAVLIAAKVSAQDHRRRSRMK